MPAPNNLLSRCGGRPKEANMVVLLRYSMEWRFGSRVIHSMAVLTTLEVRSIIKKTYLQDQDCFS